MAITFLDKHIDEELNENKRGVGDVVIGHSIDHYAVEKPIKSFQAMYKISDMRNYCKRLLDDNDNKITILELGSGNGVNGLLLAKELIDEFECKVRLIRCDVSSVLLKAAEKQTAKHIKKNLTQESIQIDFNNFQSIVKLSMLLSNQVDFVFSIKFLMNVPIKIDGTFSRLINDVLKDKGVFMYQTYDNGPLRNIYRTIKGFLGIKSGNSTQLNRLIATMWLRLNGLKSMYQVVGKATGDEFLKTTKRRCIIERYYRKDR